MRKCETVADNQFHVVQLVTLDTIEEIQEFAENSRRYGASVTINGLTARVKYLKDETGKIGPRYT